MKIFNNFDTKFKNREYEKSIDEFGEKNVLLVQRSIFYLLVRGLPILFVYLVMLGGLLFLLYLFRDNSYLFYGIIGFSVVFSVFVFYKIFNLYLDYKFDFSIFTPRKIFTFKQKGLFFSDYKDLPSEKIKSIVSGRSGLLGNIFGFGKVVIYTDGGIAGDKGIRSEAGRTKLSYASKPDTIREAIWRICVSSSEKKKGDNG